VLAAIVVAGCTTPSEGEPVPATTVETTNSSDSGPTSTSSERELPFAGAPKVDDPLDTNRFQQDPCLALTADQAQSLTLPAKYAYFDPLPPIEGYPAVATDIVDDRDAGKCTVVVGVSDEVTFEVPIRLSTVNVGHKDPCQIAAMVAGKALQTMKED
jgi:hypothetical protein